MGYKTINLSGNNFKSLDLVQSLGKDIYDNSTDLGVGGVIEIPEFIGGGAVDLSTIGNNKSSKKTDVRTGSKNSAITNKNSSGNKKQEFYVPIGQYSSARLPGQGPMIKAGDEMNALDVISEQNYLNSQFDDTASKLEDFKPETVAADKKKS